MDFDEQVGVSLVMLKGFMETDTDSNLGTGCKLNLGAQLHVFVFPLLYLVESSSPFHTQLKPCLFWEAGLDLFR